MIIKMADVNRDGKIEYDELLHFLKRLQPDIVETFLVVNRSCERYFRKNKKL